MYKLFIQVHINVKLLKTVFTKGIRLGHFQDRCWTASADALQIVHMSDIRRRNSFNVYEVRKPFFASFQLNYLIWLSSI